MSDQLTPFEPINGVARWRLVLPLFVDCERGTVVTYQQLADAIDVHPDSDRQAIRSAIRRAVPTLQIEHSRTIEAVKGIGYRVVLPAEHTLLARQQQLKSRRSISRAHSHVEHVEWEKLTDNEKALAAATIRVLTWQAAEMARLDLRQKNLSAMVESLTTRVEMNETEHEKRLGELERRLAELTGSE